MKKNSTKKPTVKAANKEDKEKAALNHQLSQVGPVSKKKSIASILGFNRNSKYKTEDVAEYVKELRALNKIDLQKECIRLGRAAHDNRETMIERLTKDFRQYVAATNSEGLGSTPPIRLSAKSREILSRNAPKLT